MCRGGFVDRRWGWWVRLWQGESMLRRRWYVNLTAHLHLLTFCRVLIAGFLVDDGKGLNCLAIHDSLKRTTSIT
jgi:hypothetical protein